MLHILANDMKVSREQLCGWLGLERGAANQKIKVDGLLNVGESERVLGMARLIGQVQRIVDESGEPNGFDAPVWTGRWLACPNPALGGRKAGEYMDTADGRKLVSWLVALMQGGGYA